MSEAAEAPRAPVTITPVRVRYPETDRMGIAYHAHYLVWYEIGRTELLRELGSAYSELEDRSGLFFPVIAVGVNYLRPARYDDCLEVHTRLAAVGGARVRFDYELLRSADQARLATGFTEHAVVGPQGRPVRMPRPLRRLLQGRQASRSGARPRRS